MVDASSQRDLREASFYQSFLLPKLYMKMLYCALALSTRIGRMLGDVATQSGLRHGHGGPSSQAFVVAKPVGEALGS